MGLLIRQEPFFCAQCGREFASASTSVVRPTSPSPPPPPSTPQPSPPPTAPSAPPSPLPQQPPYSPSTQPKRVKIGPLELQGLHLALAVILVVLLLTLGCVSLLGATTRPTPTPTVEATVAATSTPKATATPTAAKGTALTQAQLTTIENGMVSDGYTITQHLTRNGTASDGSPMYTGQMTKDGLTFDHMIISCANSASANNNYQNVISLIQAEGFTGSSTGTNQWTGTMTDATTGLQIQAGAQIVSGTNIVAVYIS